MVAAYHAGAAEQTWACGRRKNTQGGLALLWQIFSGTGFPNQFFCDLWVVGFWRGRPWLAGHRIGRDELGRFLKPFLDRLGHKARRQMCPLYVSGLIGPGDRKSIQPMAKRLALGECDQLHHFIAAGVWDAVTATATNLASGASGHPRTHHSTTTAPMPALPKMDLQRAAA